MSVPQILLECSEDGFTDVEYQHMFEYLQNDGDAIVIRMRPTQIKQQSIDYVLTLCKSVNTGNLVFTLKDNGRCVTDNGRHVLTSTISGYSYRVAGNTKKEMNLCSQLVSYLQNEFV